MIILLTSRFQSVIEHYKIILTTRQSIHIILTSKSYRQSHVPICLILQQAKQLKSYEIKSVKNNQQTQQYIFLSLVLRLPKLKVFINVVPKNVLMFFCLNEIIVLSSISSFDVMIRTSPETESLFSCPINLSYVQLLLQQG